MKPYLISILLILSNWGLKAQNVTPLSVEFETVYSGLNGPVGMYHCGDNRLFILEKNVGEIEIIDTLGNYIGTFLDIGNLVSTGGERGLLGMAFHPEYNENGKFYLNYTNSAGNTVIAKYTVSANPNIANTSGEIILTITQPFGNHNGGHIAFGPDGFLYIGMGDGGSAGDPGNRAQNLNDRLGKMLRIDVNGATGYAVPSSNPYVGVSNTQPEIWASGLRNPWKFSFDRMTGDLWIADVGQNLWEEVNVVAGTSVGGENYGWRCFEGNASYNSSGCNDGTGMTFPVAVYSHGAPNQFCSISGGVVYRGSKYPAMQGRYFFSDYCDGDLHMLAGSLAEGFVSTNLGPAGAAITAIQEDAAGEIYIVTQGGSIIKIKDSCGEFSPMLSVQNGALTVSPGDSYWWFNNSVLIPGANSMDFSPVMGGVYSANVAIGNCTRSSNSLPWVVIGGVPGCTYTQASNYSPQASVDDGTCVFSPPASCPGDFDGNGLITVTDLISFLDAFGSECTTE